MTDDELKALFKANAEEMRRYTNEATVETRRMLEGTRSELGNSIKELAGAIADSRRNVDITFEGLRYEIRLVAEKVTGLDETLTREAADIRAEMRQGFADMHAMMKFSHGELDRRIVPLEENRQTADENIADLQVRVGRLEKPPH